MANRDMFYVDSNNNLRKDTVPFAWRKGDFSPKMMNLRSKDLHDAFYLRHHNLMPMEVSSASSSSLGKQGSAMHLHVPKYNNLSVEQLFQSGKIYRHAGAMTGALNHPTTGYYAKHSSLYAKKYADKPWRNGDQLSGFQTPDGSKFPLTPKTAFYDYLYLSGIVHNPSIMHGVLMHNAFSDIHATPGKTINSQAKSCALFVSLYHKYGLNHIKQLLNNKKQFINMECKISNAPVQRRRMSSLRNQNNSRKITPTRSSNNRRHYSKDYNHFTSFHKNNYSYHHVAVKPDTPHQILTARMILDLQNTGQVNDNEITDAFKKHPNIKDTSFNTLKQLNVGWLNDNILNGHFTPNDWKAAKQRTNQEINFAYNRKNPIHLVTIASNYYPQNLKHTRNHQYPPTIYVQGNPAALNQKSVAIIGSRGNKKNPLPQSAWNNTRKYTKYFVQHGFADIGGLAGGTDSIAHREAIKDGGHAIAVMPESLDQPVYPSYHAPLAQQIINHGGALVSAEPLGRGQMLWNSPQNKYNSKGHLINRDPYQAKLADGIMPMVAGKQIRIAPGRYVGRNSGTLHAMNTAVKEHKPMAAPDFKNVKYMSPYYYGTQSYIQSGKAKPLSTSKSLNQFAHWMDYRHNNNVDKPLQKFQRSNIAKNKQDQYQSRVQSKQSRYVNNVPQNLQIDRASVNKPYWKNHRILIISAAVKRSNPKKNQSVYLTNISGAHTNNHNARYTNKVFHKSWLTSHTFNKILNANGLKSLSEQQMINKMKHNQPLNNHQLKFQSKTKHSQYFLDNKHRPSIVIAPETIQPQEQQAKDAQKNNQNQNHKSSQKNDDLEM